MSRRGDKRRRQHASLGSGFPGPDVRARVYVGLDFVCQEGHTSALVQSFRLYTMPDQREREGPQVNYDGPGPEQYEDEQGQFWLLRCPHPTCDRSPIPVAVDWVREQLLALDEPNRQFIRRVVL